MSGVGTGTFLVQAWSPGRPLEPTSPVSALDLSHLEALPKQEVVW